MTCQKSSDKKLDAKRLEIAQAEKRLRVTNDILAHIELIEYLEGQKTSTADLTTLKSNATADSGAEKKEAAVAAEVENVDYYRGQWETAREDLKKHGEAILAADAKVADAKKAIIAKRTELQKWIEQSNDGTLPNGLKKSQDNIAQRKRELQDIVDYDGADATNPDKVKAKGDAQGLIDYINNPV